MKELTYILLLFCYNQIAISQSNFGVMDFVNNSEQVFLLEAKGIDTLEPKILHTISIYSASLNYSIIESYKGEVVDNKIPLIYQISEHSHMHKAEPKIGEKYIAFTVFDTINNSYILPEHKWSLVEVTESNTQKAKNIINQIIQNPSLNECEYFDLISSNFDEAISPINRDLRTIRYYTKDLDSTFCIDGTKRDKIFNQYLKSKNKALLPFIRNYNEDKIDNQLLEEINILSTKIVDTEDLYWIEEASIILENTSNLSFIYNHKEAKSELDKISNEYYANFDKEFVIKIHNLIKKYGS